MHKIHSFFCIVFTKSYQLTLILFTLSCNLTVSQWTEFWLELKSAKKEWVHIGAGGVDFNCKVLQVSHSVLVTRLGSASLLNCLEQTTYVLRQIYYLCTMVWAPLHLWLWLSSKENYQAIFHASLSQFLLLPLHLSFPRSWTCSSAQDHWLPPLLSSHPHHIASPVAPTLTKRLQPPPTLTFLLLALLLMAEELMLWWS